MCTDRFDWFSAKCGRALFGPHARLSLRKVLKMMCGSSCIKLLCVTSESGNAKVKVPLGHWSEENNIALWPKSYHLRRNCKMIVKCH